VRIPLDIGGSRPVPHLWPTVLTVPQASESRRPKCDRITPPHLLSWPCCLRFAFPI
jgi:hypothetical protein